MLCYVMLCYVIVSYFILLCVLLKTLRYVTSRYVMLCYVMLCYEKEKVSSETEVDVFNCINCTVDFLPFLEIINNGR